MLQDLHNNKTLCRIEKILGILETLTAMMILFFVKSFYELTFWFSPRVFFCLFERMKNPKWEMKSNFFKIDSTNKLKSMDSKNGFYAKFINKTWKEVILQLPCSLFHEHLCLPGEVLWLKCWCWTWKWCQWIIFDHSWSQ